jgi:hypothetical protein
MRAHLSGDELRRGDHVERAIFEDRVELGLLAGSGRHGRKSSGCLNVAQ